MNDEQPATPTPAEPVAWLYTISAPFTGRVTQYASVSDSERRDHITDVEWAARKLTPLAATPQQPAKGAP